jgi:hypothetical protein
MASITDICNAAISHCGTRSKISAIDEGSAEANACLTHLALVRDATLRAFDWNFARLTVQLAELPSTSLGAGPNPPARWQHKYALPTDCLRLRRLNDVPLLALPETFCEIAADRDSTGAFVTVLLTQAAPVAVIYTARVADPLRWDPGFVDAMTYGLAARICFELTGKDDRVRTLTQLWQATLQRAGAEMANESSAFNRLYLPESLQTRGFVPEIAV